MPKMGSCDFSEFKSLQDKLDRLSDPVQLDKFMKKCVQEIAMETLRRVIRKTPVSATIKIVENVTDELGNEVKYKRGKNKGKNKTKLTTIHTGGTLRRGWIAHSHTEAEAQKSNSPNENSIAEYVYRLKVSKIGTSYVAWIVNVVEYASYVEYGHRQTVGRFVPAIGKRLKKSWVQGRHMLQISMQEVEARLPQFLDKYLQDYLNQIFGGK